MSYSPKRAYFALILEAYLRTCDNLSTLMQQVKAIEKLTKLSEKLKTEKEVLNLSYLRTSLSFSLFLFEFLHYFSHFMLRLCGTTYVFVGYANKKSKITTSVS